MLLSFVTFLLSFIASAEAAVSCRNQQGAPVDWYIIQKLPKILDDCPIPFARDGLAFFYMDSNNHENWTQSTESIGSQRNALSFTLNQLYTRKHSQPHFRMLYNDEFPDPNKYTDYYGHTKGAVYFEADQGFWLIHSVPRFPLIDRYEFASSGTTFGQTFICLTLNTKSELDNAAHQMLYQFPWKYDMARTLDFESVYLDKLMSNASLSDSDPFIRQTVGANIYADLVKPALNASFYVETWLNGDGDLPSRCDSTLYEVHNMREVHPAGIDYLTTKDHSKYAVSCNKSNPWVCIADNNRQKSQDHRAGGAMCLKNAKVNAIILAGTAKIENCAGDIIVPQGNPPYC